MPSCRWLAFGALPAVLLATGDVSPAPGLTFDQSHSSQSSAICADEDHWDNGLRYDLTPLPGIPNGWSHGAVWTGSRMFVWGGYDGDAWYGSGGLYDPVTDSWTEVRGGVRTRENPTVLMAGDYVFVWGGVERLDYGVNGGRYDPVTDTWLTVTPPAWLDAHKVAMPAGNMVLVGGSNGHHALYDPAADVWTSISQTGAPLFLPSVGWFGGSAVWTGEEVLIWNVGGGSLLHRYNPGTDTWSLMSIVGAPALVEGSRGAWTGHEMVVWGATRLPDGTYVMDGGRYDPVADHWSPMSQDGAPTLRQHHSMVSTGSELIVWGGGWGPTNTTSGGQFQYTSTGGRYDPVTDTWHPMTTNGAPPPMGQHTAVWADDVMLFYGHTPDRTQSDEDLSLYPEFGGRYYPPVDADADGFTACEGDCDDANASVGPNGLDLPGNLLDEDCDSARTCDPEAHWRGRGQLNACIVRDCNKKANEGLISRDECLAASGIRPHPSHRAPTLP